MRPHVLMILTAGLLVGADTTETEMGRLQGTWSLVMAARDGEEVPDEVSRTTLVIRGETFAIADGTAVGVGPSGALKIDPSGTPKWIDLTPSSGPGAGKTWLGIYEADGNLLNLCVAPPGKPRPARLSSSPGIGLRHAVWRRARPDPAAGPDADRFRGTWSIESVTVDGQRLEDPTIRGARLAAGAGRYTVTVGEQTLKVSYRPDPTASPNAVDLTYHDETGDARTFRGIYKREGDTLVLCRPRSPGGERPREFAAPAGSGRVLLVLKKTTP